MRVLVDQQPVDVATKDGPSLAGVVEFVRAQVAGRQRVVGRIIIDGEPIPPDQFDQWLLRPCQQVGQIEFETASLRDLARETLGAVGLLLADISKLQQTAAEKLAGGQTGKAMETLLGCLNLYKTGQEAVSQVVQLTRLDVRQVRIGEQTIEGVFTQLAGQLLAVKSALEARDFALLGDLLSYEFPKATDQWRAILAKLDAILAEPG